MVRRFHPEQSMPNKRTPAGRIKIDLQRRTPYRFSLLAARQTRCLAEMYMQKFGLSVTRWKVLAVIGHYAPMSAKQAAERTSLEPEKVTRAVDGLVQRKLVMRRQDPADRRRVILSLSAKGTAIYNESELIRRAIESEFLDALKPAERALFYALLDKLERRASEIFVGKQAWRQIVANRKDASAAKANGRDTTGAVA
jgi:DNA-binding MarR family transcriptional regulator